MLKSRNRHCPLESSPFGSTRNDSNISAMIGSFPGSVFMSLFSAPAILSGSPLQCHLCSLNLIFMLGKRQKSHGAKSGQYGGVWGMTVMFWERRVHCGDGALSCSCTICMAICLFISTLSHLGGHIGT
jgi:hypothetical protein